MKKNSCVLIKQYVHVGHHIMMSQYPIHIFTSEAQFLAYIFLFSNFDIARSLRQSETRDFVYLKKP